MTSGVPNNGKPNPSWYKNGHQHSKEELEKIKRSLKGKVPWNKGIEHSKETREKISKTKTGKKYPQNSGENHLNWKGENVSYMGLHNWVRREKGKPKVCRDCGATCKEKRICWANIDHKYKRNLDDFISLCYYCHRQHDLKYNNFQSK